MVRIVFLGTGGGRHATMFQTRCTGGILVECGGRVLHIDPGPGALVQMNRISYDLGKTDSVLITHCHPDHYSDAASVIEGITRGGWTKRGYTYGSVSVMEGHNGLGPCLSGYHLGLTSENMTVRPGDRFDICGMTALATAAKHSDPTTFGLVLETADGKIGYTSDTAYDESIAEQYKGCRVLILNVTTPYGDEIEYHLCTDTAAKICEIAKPELAVFVHLGVVMLRKNPEFQAEICQKISGVRTVAGRDRMTLDMGDEITIGDLPPADGGEWFPPWSP